MIVLGVVLWVLAVLATAGALVAVAVAIRTRHSLLALVALLPSLVGAVLVASRIEIDPQTRVLPILLAFALAGLGIGAGNPFATAVLDRTAPAAEPGSAHGGIMVRGEGADESETREVMRGGGVIGYLERIAVVGAIAVGHPEVLAAVIAVKGLGRFSELDTSEARERFIIGTLVSLIWASLCGGLVWVLLR